MIVILKFRTEVAFSEDHNFRAIMEAFLRREISYSETGKLLNADRLEEVAVALGALFVLAQQKEPGFQLKTYSATRKWRFYRRQQQRQEGEQR